MIGCGCFNQVLSTGSKKMKSSRGLGTNLAGSSIRKTQESMVTMAASPGKTQTGRIAQCEAVTVQTPDEMSAALNTTSQRATTDHTVVVTSAHGSARKMASTEEPDKSEMMKCQPGLNEAVRGAINRSIENLEKAWEERKDSSALLRCRDVVTEMNFLIRKYKINKKDPESVNYQLIKDRFGPHYVDNLNPALKELKNEIDAGYGVVYYKLLVSMIRHFRLQPGESPEKKNNKQLLKAVCQQLLCKEMEYLRHIKIKQDSSLEKAAIHSGRIIGYLLDKTSPVRTCQYIKKDVMSSIEAERNSLIAAITSDDKNSNVGEDLEKLKEDLCRGTDDVWAARRYHDRLWLQLAGLQSASSDKKKSVQDCIFILEKLCELRNVCTGFFKESFSLCHEVTASISGVARRILKDSMDDIVLLDEEIMDLMGALMVEDLLGEECRKLYLVGKEFQAVMRSAVQTDTITDNQCAQHIAEIRSLIGNKTDADFLTAAEMLRQLLLGHWHEIKSLDMADEHVKGIEEIKDVLREELFAPVFEKFVEHKEISEKDFKEYGYEISKHRSRLVQLNLFLFVVNDKKEKNKWMKSVDVAWYRDLERLVQTESFRDEDVDCLLELKRTVPDVPNPCIMLLLKKNLIRLFSSDILAVKGGNGEIPVEKVAMISRWIDDFLYLKGISSKHQKDYNMELKELNEVWKCANKGTIPGATSGQPVSDAALVQQPEPGELSTSRTTSPASMAKASAAETAPETGVCPESRIDSRRDQSLVPDFSEATEQLALATIGIGTVTERASQASSSLQGADQLPFNIQD